MKARLGFLGWVGVGCGLCEIERTNDSLPTEGGCVNRHFGCQTGQVLR